MLHLGVAAAIALAAPADLRAPDGPRPTPIYGGQPSAPGAWPAVVAISIGNMLCTGTLVSSNVVLTAAHCLDTHPDVGSMRVHLGNDINGPNKSLAVIAYDFDPEFCAADTCKEDIHDFGYVVIADAQPQVTYPRVITAQDEWDEVMFVDAPITIVGFGLDEFMTTGVKREVEVPITRFSKSGLEFQAGGDDLDSCQGDSGGPAFAKLSTGEYVLAGVTSRGYTCGKGGFYSAPIGGLCWLQQSSGLDLRPPGCGACDCVDTTPASGGCGCTSGAPDPAALLVLPALALALRRRRRR